MTVVSPYNVHKILKRFVLTDTKREKSSTKTYYIVLYFFCKEM